MWPRLILLGCVACVAVSTLRFAPAQSGRSSVTGEKQALERGREAMQAGNHAEAAGHFLFALERTEKPEPILDLLLQNAVGQPDAFALWAWELADRRVAASGKLKWSRSLSAQLGEAGPLGDWSPQPLALAASRADALAAVLKEIDKKRKARRPGSKVEIEWLEDFARALAAPGVELHKAVRNAAPEIEAKPAQWKAVMSDLRSTGSSLLKSGQWSEAIRAGRILKGLAAQANFGDKLDGPAPPNASSEMAAANEILSRARAALAQRPELALDLAAVEAMSDEERRELTVDRASFGEPAVTESPNGMYRVETSCGWETLYGAATTVEYHHRRLANFFGRDPFENRQGTLRVVPEAYGLEAEGTPHWWAGGFQSGDLTVLQFTLSTIPGLGRGITHELTHRFDGALYPGLPAWLVEGKASWTAGAYGSMKETSFVANHCSFGTMNGTIGLGYNREDELRNLVAGTIEEYRDNCTAGTALFVYLNTWMGSEDVDGEYFGEDGTLPTPADGEAARQSPPLYAGELQKFMEERKRLRNDPIKVFEAYFCDGEQGRPDDFAEFSARFSRFLAGFNYQDPQPWRDRYTQDVPGSDPGGVVQDEPTWTWLRKRAEPWFGQEHARMAGDLFADLGKEKEAIRAYTWALAVDEPAPATMQGFAEVLQAASNPDAAWIVRNWPRYSGAGVEPDLRRWPEEGKAADWSSDPEDISTAAPFVRKLGAVRAYLQALQSAALEAEERSWLMAASALRAEHNRLAAWLGLDEIHGVALGRPRLVEDGIDRGWAPIWRDVQLDDGGAAALHPRYRPWQIVPKSAWHEAKLTGYEEGRVEALWFEDRSGALHVGRKSEQRGTGKIEAASPSRTAVVFSDLWFDAGRYAVSMQIEPTTAILSGGVTLGWSRRDRNIRIGMSQADRRYASGERDEYQVEALNWSVDGLYARQSAIRGTHTMAGTRSFHELTLEVDGPTLDVFYDGKLMTTLSTLDRSAIHGKLGFYTSQGAMKVSNLRYRRLDRAAHESGARSVGSGLHPARDGEEKWRWMLGRPVTGLPLAPSGTLLLWFPEQSAERIEGLGADDWYNRVADELNALLDALESEFPSQGLLVVVPPSFPQADLAALREGFGPHVVGGFDVVRHARIEPLEEEARTIQGWRRPLFGFVDPTGFLRYAKRQGRPSSRLPNDLTRLLTEYQDHSRPGRAGAGD